MTTSSPFSITPTPPTAIKLAPGQDGTFSFTITSLAAPDKIHDVLLQALLVGEGDKRKEVDWLVVGPSRTATLSGGKTETVSITARPTATSPRGENTIKLAVADKDRPNDAYAYSSPVTCEVIASTAPSPPPKPPPRWLIPALVAGGVVVLGGGALLIWKASRHGGSPPGLDEPCRSDARTPCGDGLVCVAGVNRCLRPGGISCDPAKARLCASGECDSTSKRCTIPLGGACVPGDNVMVCAKDSACDPRTRTCAASSGGCGSAGGPRAGWDDAQPETAGDTLANLGPAADSRLTGSSATNGGANVDGAEIIVGDWLRAGGPTKDDDVGALTFDLTGIPVTAKIVSAMLQVFQTGVTGAVYNPPMTAVVVDHVRFRDAWGAQAAAAIPGTVAHRTLSTSPAVEWRSVDVTPAVRYELATCTTRAQFRLTFVPANRRAELTENSARFASDNAASNRPQLVIRYH